MSRTPLSAIALLGLLGCQEAAEPLPYFDSPDFTPQWLTEDTLPADFHRLTPFSLTDQDGQPFTEADMLGKVAVVDFFFTFCPGICPQLTESMARIDAAIDASAELVLVSHSVAPEHDTPQKLSAFAARSGITSPRWFFLTGARAEIYTLGRSVYYIEEDMGREKSPEDFLHTENIVLLDRAGHLRGVYNGLRRPSVDQLIEDIQTLLAE